MALFTDGTFVTLADLTALDAEAFAVADAHDIDLTGVIMRAIGEAVAEITSRVQASGGGIYASAGISSAHLNAVLNTGISGAINRPYFRMSNVVIHSPYRGLPSPLKQWVESKALAILYRSVLNRKVDDRFQEKFDRFVDQMEIYWARLLDVGIPVVYTPLPCPGATLEPNAGSWIITETAGAGTAGAYYVAITWTASGYVSSSNKGNAESASSSLLAFTTSGTNVLVVNITGLNPPAGHPASLGYADGQTPYATATGWNVYTGTDPAYLRLQNPTPIPIATKTYTFDAAPTTDGALIGEGQYPDINFSIGAGRVFRG